MIVFLQNHIWDIAEKTLEHFYLVSLAISFALLTGVPLAILAITKSKLKNWIMQFANIVQTIPSLALFGFLIPMPFIGGIGAHTAIIALTLYSLLPIIRNIITGIEDIPPAIVEAAKGMGMTKNQILFQIQIPLASSVILAGIRTSTVLAIGIATIAAAIGAGGLGDFIFRGVAMVDNHYIMAGAIPAALFAIITDALLGIVESKLKLKLGQNS